MALLGYGQKRRAHLDNALKRQSNMHVITDSVAAPRFANTPEVAPAEASTPVGTPSDRRRPGRLEQVSPTLVPLFRGAAQNVHIDLDIDYTAPLAAARGIALGTCLAVPLWALIGVAGWLIWSIL
jgi:hypothetical protein